MMTIKVKSLRVLNDEVKKFCSEWRDSHPVIRKFWYAVKFAKDEERSTDDDDKGTAGG